MRKAFSGLRASAHTAALVWTGHLLRGALHDHSKCSHSQSSSIPLPAVEVFPTKGWNILAMHIPHQNIGTPQINKTTDNLVEKWAEDLKTDSSGGAVVKNPPANAGDMGSSPGPGRSHVPRSKTKPERLRARAPQQEKPTHHNEE